MKTTVNMRAPVKEMQKLPYIGKGNLDAAIIMFVSRTTGPMGQMVKGIVLEPGAGDHGVGDWVTYTVDRYPPLVGTVTLEN